MDITQLPNDMIEKIGSFLSTEDKLNARQVCHYFNASIFMTNTDLLFLKLFNFHSRLPLDHCCRNEWEKKLQKTDD